MSCRVVDRIQQIVVWQGIARGAQAQDACQATGLHYLPLAIFGLPLLSFFAGRVACTSSYAFVLDAPSKVGCPANQLAIVGHGGQLTLGRDQIVNNDLATARGVPRRHATRHKRFRQQGPEFRLEVGNFTVGALPVFPSIWSVRVVPARQPACQHCTTCQGLPDVHAGIDIDVQSLGSFQKPIFIVVLLLHAVLGFLDLPRQPDALFELWQETILNRKFR